MCSLHTVSCKAAFLPTTVSFKLTSKHTECLLNSFCYMSVHYTCQLTIASTTSVHKSGSQNRLTLLHSPRSTHSWSLTGLLQGKQSVLSLMHVLNINHCVAAGFVFFCLFSVTNKVRQIYLMTNHHLPYFRAVVITKVTVCISVLC